MVQTTLVGAATAVVVTGPAVAVAVTGCQAAGFTHSHVATLTSCGWPSGGAISITGDDSPRVFAACSATTTGASWTVAVAGFAPVTQTAGIGSIAPGPAHTGNTHWPGCWPPTPSKAVADAPPAA